MPKRKNPVYQYFQYNEKKMKYRCTNCIQENFLKGEFAENLMRHLQSHHREIYEKLDHERRADENNKDGNSILNFVERREKKPVVLNLCKEDIIDVMVELICVNGKSLNTIENSSIIRLLKPIFDQFDGGFALNRKNIKNEIDNKAMQIRGSMKRILNDKIISLTADIATRRSRSYLSINCHFIMDSKIVVYCLAMKQLHKSHTGKYINQAILQIIREHDIKIRNIYSITTDNGANIINATNLLLLSQADGEEN